MKFVAGLWSGYGKERLLPVTDRASWFRAAGQETDWPLFERLG
jgi:hypothetical protein